MGQLECLLPIEVRLWEAADTLRANSKLASNQYMFPVMGLIFLRHAYSRYLAERAKIIPTLPKREGKTRALRKEDFAERGAIFLREKAQFDYLVALPDGVLADGGDRIAAVIAAMDAIEADYKNLRGVLPKEDYRKLNNTVLGQLLRILNPEELKKVSGDVFGRIYEYFLTKFADQKAHDGGEFFTPVSLVSVIAHILEPKRGRVLDPACGSGGMFVQSARIVREQNRNQSVARKLTFYGAEKTETTIPLAKMNLAVHGLEGEIVEANTYYDDPHGLVGRADYVMANPPFNVDLIDAESIRADARLPFGLPGVNKKDKVSNGNYIWISYFYSYLSPQGRAGFVMSSQASSAGGGEAAVRQKLVETGSVDVMIAIRSNFFYTRSVPCELWFFDRNKPAVRKDCVLMIDARGVYREVTRKIFDFSPEQEQNLCAIVWLYRGEKNKFLNLVAEYLHDAVDEAKKCFENNGARSAVTRYISAVARLLGGGSEGDTAASSQAIVDATNAHEAYKNSVKNFEKTVLPAAKVAGQNSVGTVAVVKKLADKLAVLADDARALAGISERVYKDIVRHLDAAKKENADWKPGNFVRLRKEAEAAQKAVSAQLLRVHYLWGQARWLLERFPGAELCDVDGLVKLVSRAEIAANDWSLSPGRYVGVATERDEDFDFKKSMAEIHSELDTLNRGAVKLAATIQKNFKEMKI